MPIELLGFEPVFENRVYVRPQGEDVVEVLRLTRYTPPTEETVLQYLQEQAPGALATRKLLIPGMEEKIMEGRSPLEIALMSLPEKVIRDIQNGVENCHKFIRMNTPAPASVQGEARGEYCRTTYGRIPIQVIEENERAETIKDEGWYDAALEDKALRENGFGEQWNFRVKIGPEGFLPPLEVMELLLNYGVHGSRMFDVSKVYYPLDAVREVVRIIYGGISTPSKVAEVEDITSQVLKRVSLQPVLALYEWVKRSAAAAELSSRTGNIFGGISGSGRGNGGTRLS